MSLSFSAKDPAEQLTLSFDFTALLASGETVTSCTFTITHTLDGALQPAMLSGVADISAAPIVRQAVVGGTLGEVYSVKATVVTSAGHTLVGVAYLPVTMGGW